MSLRGFIACLFILVVSVPTISHSETLTLEEAVQIALSNHQRIRQAEELYSASSASANAASNDRLPSLDLGLSYDRLYDKPYQAFNGNQLITSDEDQFHYQITLTQPLFTGFSLSARKKLAELDVDMARYDLQQVRRKLALDVHIAALRLLQTQALQQLAKQQCTQLERHLHDVQAAYDQGMVPGNDRLKAEVALASARQHLRSITSRVKLTRSSLNLLLKRPQQNSLTIVEPQTIQKPQLSLQQLTETALQQRPEVATARTAITAIGEKKNLVKSKNYPHVALVASYWRDGDNLSASHNAYTNEDNAAIGVHLNWNLFSGGADHARLAAVQHQQRAQRQALLELEDMVRLQVEDAFDQLDVAANNEKTAEKALEQARENHRLSVLQFHENLISTSDLLAAQTLLTRAEADLRTAHYGSLLATAQLSYALGQDPLPETEVN